MSTFIFLRHAHSAANLTGTLTGHLPGVALSPRGVRESKALVQRIGNVQIDHIRLSPIERCALTIDPWIHSRHSRTLTSFAIDDGFSEIDFGRWSGRKLSSLRKEPLWRDIQERPSIVTFPGGESFRGAQKRAFQSFNNLCEMRGDKTFLVVSHSDTIKLLLSKILSLTLDSFQSLQIDPASFSIVRSHKNNFSLTTMNNSGTLKDFLHK